MPIRFRHLVGLVALAACLAACSSGTSATARESASRSATAEQSASVVPTERATPTASPTPVLTTFDVGDVITITHNDAPWADFTVLEVQQAAEYVDPGGYFNDTPQTDGYVFLAANVRYEARVDGVNYNPFDFQIFVDGRAVDSTAFAINGPEPQLSSGTLPAGRTAEGWLLYEVPPTGEVLLSYTGNMFLDEAPVFEVVLRE